MVIVSMPDGTTKAYRLRRTREGLRVELRWTSYDLVTMVDEAGWRIVAVETETAKRLLASAGLLTGDVKLPTRHRWRGSVGQGNRFNVDSASI